MGTIKVQRLYSLQQDLFTMEFRVTEGSLEYTGSDHSGRQYTTFEVVIPSKGSTIEGQTQITMAILHTYLKPTGTNSSFVKMYVCAKLNKEDVEIPTFTDLRVVNPDHGTGHIIPIPNNGLINHSATWLFVMNTNDVNKLSQSEWTLAFLRHKPNYVDGIWNGQKKNNVEPLCYARIFDINKCVIMLTQPSLRYLFQKAPGQSDDVVMSLTDIYSDIVLLPGANPYFQGIRTILPRNHNISTHTEINQTLKNATMLNRGGQTDCRDLVPKTQTDVTGSDITDEELAEANRKGVIHTKLTSDANNYNKMRQEWYNCSNTVAFAGEQPTCKSIAKSTRNASTGIVTVEQECRNYDYDALNRNVITRYRANNFFHNLADNTAVARRRIPFQKEFIFIEYDPKTVSTNVRMVHAIDASAPIADSIKTSFATSMNALFDTIRSKVGAQNKPKIEIIHAKILRDPTQNQFTINSVQETTDTKTLVLDRPFPIQNQWTDEKQRMLVELIL
jgi:hypothetical protein